MKSICILKGVNGYECESYFITEKICRVIDCFAKKVGISLDEALGFFYHSEVYHLMREGISDMHCMSDGYLAEDLETEYKAKIS